MCSINYLLESKEVKNIYRLLVEQDINNNDFYRMYNGEIDYDSYDIYIPCARKVKVYYYGNVKNSQFTLCENTISAYVPSANVCRDIIDNLENKMKLKIAYELSDKDGIVYFHSDDLKVVLDYLKPRTSGAKIHPFDESNLEWKEYKISQKDINKYNDLKLGFTRKQIQELEIAFAKKSKLDFDKKRKLAKVEGIKEYIHSLGLWVKYIAFMTEYKKNNNIGV